jgi:hypothetical protein
MLTAVPKSWFSWDFTVMDGAQPVGDIDVSWWREKGVLTVDGADYRVYRDCVMAGDFILALDDEVLAREETERVSKRVHRGLRRQAVHAETDVCLGQSLCTAGARQGRGHAFSTRTLHTPSGDRPGKDDAASGQGLHHLACGDHLEARIRSSRRHVGGNVTESRTADMDAQSKDEFNAIRADLRSTDARVQTLDRHLHEVDARLSAEIRRMETTLRQEIREDGIATRRHFDVVSESLRDDIRIIAEGLIALD